MWETKLNKNKLTRIFIVRVFPPQFFFSSIFCGGQEFKMTAIEVHSVLNSMKKKKKKTSAEPLMYVHDDLKQC